LVAGSNPVARSNFSEMSRFFTILVVALALAGLAACKENPGKEYGKAIVRPIERAGTAADAANLEALRKSVESYRALNGTYPESIEELASSMGLDASRYRYDPATGRVAQK
jgi:hypothetical protein